MNAKYAAKLGILMTGLGAGTVCGQDLQPGRLGDAAGPEVFIDMSVRRRLPDCTRFIHEPSEAAAQRAESYEAGRYYPPEDVAQTLREL